MSLAVARATSSAGEVGAAGLAAASDQGLLRAFVEHKSQPAFAALVARHINLVYGAARRQVRDVHVAEDVAQAVFIVLARRAKSIGPSVSIAGWLVKTAHFAARDALRRQARRARHEQRAATMMAARSDEDGVWAGAAGDASSSAMADEVAPHLDAALARLSALDRGAVVMRFFEDRSVHEVATALGVTPAAAQKRVSRAVIKLRGYLARRGAVVPAAGMIAALSATHAQAAIAPPALAATVTTSATAAVGAAGTVAGASSAIAIAKGAAQAMVWGQVKSTAAIVAVALACAGGTGVLVQRVLADSSSKTPPVSTASAPATAPSDALPGSLANGVVVQLIGVADGAATNHTWWRPDGGAMPNPASPTTNMTIPALPGRVTRRIALTASRAVRGGEDLASIRWMLLGNPTVAGRTSITRGDDSPRELHFTTFGLPEAPTMTLRCDVAAGAWQTRMTAVPGGGVATGDGKTVVMLGRPFDDRGSAGLPVVVTNLADLDQRVIAIDRSGGTRTAQPDSTMSVGTTTLANYRVADLPLSSVKEFRFQTRPFDQWIEFVNVCADPSKPSHPTIRTSDK